MHYTLSIIGTGMIATEVLKMLNSPHSSLDRVEGVSIYAHRDIEKANTLASLYNINKVYTDYDELLREDTADFVYIANANSVHYEYCKKALLAGRNVIVEKPMCPTWDEARQLVDLALAHHLYLFEAVSLNHMPLLDILRQQLQRIGRVRLVHCDFTQYSSRYDRYLNGDITPVFNPDCKGGALLDLNVYNLNFMIALFGNPSKRHVYLNRGHNGIDTSGTIILEYPDFHAILTAAKDCYGNPHAIIQGEKGQITINGPVSILQSFSVVVGKGEPELFQQDADMHRLSHEFRHFGEIYCSTNYVEMQKYLELSLNVAAQL